VAEVQTPNEVPVAPPGYKIVKKMGQGGMATVYLAIQESFGRHVALKIMSDQLGQDTVWARRFIHEAQVVAQLSHPNIVPVFDVGTFNGRFYISMELLKGGNLDDKIAKGLSIPDIVRIIVGVAAGLDFAGEKGFVHRDIKPDNVMFREDGSPVILDFGIVKQKGGSADKMTQTGTIVGTTAYMSPEQAMGAELDEGSDIYSLGIMFYELLAGRVPFQGDSAVAVLLKHVNEAPPPLPEFVSVFQPVIDKALAKKRSDRYPRARAMIEHLQELEPQIRQLISKQQQAVFSQGGGDDATNVQSAINGKTATMSKAATRATAALNKQTSETELTDVLSSAKATISNFSEESRVRRARNTRRGIIAAAVIVVVALGYVAYQQFYVVPHASQIAAQQRQEKITGLLSAAQDTMSKLVLTDTKAADALITQYREILVLDSENADVRDAMDKLGQQYVDLANKELGANNISMAETYRDYAEQLAPKNTQLSILRDALKTASASSMQQEFNQKQVTDMLADVQNDIRAGKTFTPADDNAYNKLQQILKIDPENAEVKTQISTLLNNLYTQTQNQITSKDLHSAASNLDLLDRFYADKTKLSALRTVYNSTKQKADEEAKLAGVTQKKDELLDKAARLKHEQRTDSINSEMRDTYLAVLNIEPNNAAAQAGLEDANRFASDSAEQSIKQRDYNRAGQNIAGIEKATPNYPGLGILKTKLAQAKTAAQKADQLIASANELTNTSKTDDAKRQDLAKAYTLIDSARQTDVNNPGIGVALSALETQYVRTISQLMATQNNALVTAYFNDADGKAWPTDSIANLKLAKLSAPTTAVAIPADKPKPKRVISGGF